MGRRSEGEQGEGLDFVPRAEILEGADGARVNAFQ